MSLRLQINLILSGFLFLGAALLLALQIDNARRSVHEEMVGANVVATQLLSHLPWGSSAANFPSMVRYLQDVGRLRANSLELRDDEGTLVYQSPPYTYKAGREAPAWYSALVTPPLQPRVIVVPVGRIIVQADASRAVLDGWDELQPVLWTVLAAFVLCNALVYALVGRVLRPLQHLLQGLHQVAQGDYGVRLGALRGREARAMRQAFNHMAQSVQESIEARRQARAAEQALAENRAFTQRMQARIEQERALIARELHDELGQQVTAIKSVGLAIARRMEGVDAQAAHSARLVMQCADQIYDGMHRLIANLRPLALDQFGLQDALRDLLAQQQLQHPGLQIEAELPDQELQLSDALATAVYRIVQEGLTNVLRHAQASRLDIRLQRLEGCLQLRLRDNGCGRVAQFQTQGHFGLAGMRERAEALQGRFELLQCEPAGVEILARFPLSNLQDHA